MKTIKKFNKVIRIYRSDVEKMKSQLKHQADGIWDEYYFWKEVEKYYQTNEIMSALEVWRELDRIYSLYDKADALLADESFDFIIVDADDWFEEWDVGEYIGEGHVDRYYMLPNSDEVDEIFETMKSNYKYTVVDLFGFFRFCPLDEDVVVA